MNIYFFWIKLITKQIGGGSLGVHWGFTGGGVTCELKLLGVCMECGVVCERVILILYRRVSLPFLFFRFSLFRNYEEEDV